MKNAATRSMHENIIIKLSTFFDITLSIGD